MVPSSPWPSRITGFLALLFLTWPILGSPGTVLLCDPTSEAMGHLWGLDVVTDGLLTHGPFVRVTDEVGYPDGFHADFMDPINLVVFAPVRWLTGSSGLAWNALHVFWFAVGMIGCAALARRIAPGRSWAGSVLIAAFPLSAYFLAHDVFGRTEYLPALAFPLHLAWLHDALFGEVRVARSAIASGVALGAIALGGWYLAVFALLVVVPISLAWAASSDRPARARLLALVVTGGVALALVLPAVVAFLGSSQHFLESYASRAMPPNREVGVAGAVPFLHQFRIPIPDVGMILLDQPAYPGIVAMLGALVGLFARSTRWAILGWLALLLWLLVWATGIDFVLVSDATGHVVRSVPGLPRLLKLVIPATGGMTSWNRLGSIVGLVAGVALVRSLASSPRLDRWTARAWPALVLAIVLDNLTWPRALELVPRTFDARPPADLVTVANALPAGALLLLPFDIGVPGREPVMRQHYLLWQRALGHPITGAYGLSPESTMRRSALSDVVFAIERVEYIRMTGSTAQLRSGIPLGDPLLGPCLRADTHRLEELGVSAIVLIRSLQYGAVIAPLIEQWLGPAQVQSGTVSGWALRDIAIPPIAECERWHLDNISEPTVR